MTKDYSIAFAEDPFSEDEDVLWEKLNAEGSALKRVDPMQYFGFFIKTAEGEVVGGITGTTYFGCLNIDLLWIDPSLRHQGLGQLLMENISEIAKTRHCTFSTVSTMDWQARPFYEQLGYVVKYIHEGYQDDAKLLFLEKKF